MPHTDVKIEISSQNKSITNHEFDSFDIHHQPRSRSNSSGSCAIPKPIIIAENSEKINTNTKQRVECNSKLYNSLFHFIWNESVSSIPIYMRYFAFHELTVLICGGLYYLQSDIGVLFLSIVPGLFIIAIFTHFLITQFKDIEDKSNKNIKATKSKINGTFYSIKHYLVALLVFIIGACSIYMIYQTNTYLSTLIPVKYNQDKMSHAMTFIGEILKFPHSQSIKYAKDLSDIKPFNYRISFVGSIIAPVIEESFKYLLICLTFPITFIWSFAYKKSSYSDYCIESLFIMFIAVCGGCGIAIMENIGYLAACQWESTKTYCLPNKNFDILGAGLARGVFSVPFHCVTSCIMADVLCMWMKTNFNNNKCILAFKFILSYPISIILPVFLHSSFNYWMKGVPAMTGAITICGFAFLTWRIAKKHSYINGFDEEKTKVSVDDDNNNEEKRKDVNGNDLSSIEMDTISMDVCVMEPVNHCGIADPVIL